MLKLLSDRVHRWAGNAMTLVSCRRCDILAGRIQALVKGGTVALLQHQHSGERGVSTRKTQATCSYATTLNSGHQE